ncbi:hypothetical protein MSG28_002212 [Choristoneura fumiferana]|uniref:Uncharacterized protein n=1 Tax=Choristoneura fumiferana TaxID=7141 RepID=A0ACC0JUV4_CHOFU|nr:hypothetical protein MSG28_002212 [Choristoneura fumiferana]
MWKWFKCFLVTFWLATAEECMGALPTSASTSLRDLMLEPAPARPPPQPSPPQRQRPDSRIPTSTKEHYVVEKKSENFARALESNAKEDNTFTAPKPATRDYVMPHTANTLNRHNSYKETKSTTDLSTGNNLRQSSSEMSLGPPSLGPRSLSFTRTSSENSRRRVDSVRRENVVSRAVEAAAETEPEFVPFATDRSVGLDLDEFLPRTLAGAGARRGARGGGAEPSEQEVLGVMMRGHDSMMAVLSARQRALQFALESVIALEDTSVILDILNVMAHKPYMQCGCNALRLIVRNFSSVVRANVSAPVRTLGVDIPREERYAKCVQIHRLLLDVRAFLLKRQTLQGRLGAAFRDLHTLMQQGLD